MRLLHFQKTNFSNMFTSIAILLFIIAFLALILSVYFYKRNKLERLNNCLPQPLLAEEYTPFSNNRKLVLLGDSRIGNWPEDAFDASDKVLKFGIPGGTTKELLCSINNKILKIRPEWYIVQVGINDLVAASMVSKHQREQIHEAALSNVKHISEKLSSTGSKVIVLTVVPPISTDLMRRFVWGKTINDDSEKFSKELMSKLPNAILVYDMKNLFFDEGKGTWRKELSIDALHWNTRAYKDLTYEMKAIVSKHPNNHKTI